MDTWILLEVKCLMEGWRFGKRISEMREADNPESIKYTGEQDWRVHITGALICVVVLWYSFALPNNLGIITAITL